MLLRKIEDLGLLENTAVIFTSDHGTYLGEHGYVGKRDHLYEEVAHIPLIMRLPDSEGASHERCEAVVQSPDLMPTILELAGARPPPTVQAKSFLQILRGEETQEREIAVSSPSLVRQRLPSWITVTSKEWSLLAARVDASPKDVSERKVESELYHLPTDPSETRNLYSERTGVAEDLRSKMITLLRSMGTKEEIVNQWMQK